MGSNNLNNRSSGQTILDTFFNDIHQGMNGDFIGRGATGVPTAGQSLGTVALPWGTIRGTSLVLNGSAVDTSSIVSVQNRVTSGKKRSTSNQPAYIIPNGAAASFIVDGTPVNLVFDVNGSEVSVITDITKSSLTLAPGSNNTALVNDTDAADQDTTKTWGEPGSFREYITIDTVGTGITALVGKWAAFKLAGVSTEYFLAFVNSATQLTKCFRGYYYDSSSLPINRSGFSNNDTITLMSLAWIFVENDATTVDVTYTNPVWSFSAPNSPSTGDYWYDLGNQTWKRYDGASFNIINRTWIGMAIIDTANCVGARCVDFFANYSDVNSMRLEVQTTEIVRAKVANTKVSVAGMTVYFGDYLPKWNITTDLAPAADMYDATEQASRLYYTYLKDTGEEIISDIEPYDRGDLLGKYHPHNPWRMIGSFYNDAGSDVVSAGGFNLRQRTPTVQTLLSGSGTYITPPGALYLKVRMVGGGGGGSGSGTAGGGNGGNGGNTVLLGDVPAVIAAYGGSGGPYAGGGGGGGVATITGTGFGVGFLGFQGGAGGPSAATPGSAGGYSPGGNGAASPFGGQGGGGINSAGSAAIANTGSGGGGGSGNSSANNYSGSGGGAGGYIEVIIASPLPSYPYAVGDGGVLGSAGTNGNVGAAGGSGVIIIEEFYS